LRIVAIGGGTGLSTLLRGLKRYVQPAGDLEPAVDITAVVTVSDDGGSSGRIRREFDILPPGDIRNCMVALSEDEALLSRLFNYRFSTGRGLKGHSFGNLFLTALTSLTGDFAGAVKMSSEILASAGRIYPSTKADVILEATLDDGTVVVGESKISKSKGRIRTIRLQPRRCRPLQGTLEAIAAADLITFGPGSLYTSVVPNVLVEGIPEAIRASGALRAYFCNLMWQPGETSGLSASEHVLAINEHAGKPVIDHVIVNSGEILEPLLRKYERRRQRPVVNDVDCIRALGMVVVEAPLASRTHLVRHDPDRAAAIAVSLAVQGRARKKSLAPAETARAS
jgi:uncharacterized cofD-like protein